MPAWQGGWSSLFGADYALYGRTNGSANRKLSRALRGLSAAKYKRIVRTFVTDDVGTTATATHKRITAQTGQASGEIGASLGGVRATETITDINRAITAADETLLLADVDGVHTPTWPTEKSGNSGGGKLGF